MEKFIQGISDFMNNELDFLNLGNYAPAAYIAALGVILIFVVFLIALIAKNNSFVLKQKKLYDDTTAYINTVGLIDETNVEGLNQKIQTMEHSVSKGWGNFLTQQTGYPSDYITEQEMLSNVNISTMGAGHKNFFNIAGWVVIALCAILAAIGCFENYGTSLESITMVSIVIIATVVAPILFYVIFSILLSGAAQKKKLIASFRSFQDVLDNNVILFVEEQDEFVSENIEEINATIEEILANKLDDSEIIEIVTTPKIVDEDEFLPKELTFIKEDVVEEAEEVKESYVEQQQEVVATVTEEPRRKYEVEEDPYAMLLELVYATDGMISDPQTTTEDVERLMEILSVAKNSRQFSAEEAQQIFDTCISILNKAVYKSN